MQKRSVKIADNNNHATTNNNTLPSKQFTPTWSSEVSLWSDDCEPDKHWVWKTKKHSQKQQFILMRTPSANVNNHHVHLESKHALLWPQQANITYTVWYMDVHNAEEANLKCLLNLRFGTGINYCNCQLFLLKWGYVREGGRQVDYTRETSVCVEISRAHTQCHNQVQWILIACCDSTHCIWFRHTWLHVYSVQNLLKDKFKSETDRVWEQK